MPIKHLLPTLCVCLCLPTTALADSHMDTQDTPYPSAELLEFLAEFGELDEQTYELIEYHALRDLKPDTQGETEDE